VLIDADDEPRITDFGLAKTPRIHHRADLKRAGARLATVHAPEQATGRQRQGRRPSDVYSWAQSFTTSTGRPPFMARRFRRFCEGDQRGTFEARNSNPAVPADLETLCLKCLEKEMSRRYPSAFGAGRGAGPVPAGRAHRGPARRPHGKPGAGAAQAQVASLTAVAMLTFLLGFCRILWEWRVARRIAADEAQQRQRPKRANYRPTPGLHLRDQLGATSPQCEQSGRALETLESAPVRNFLTLILPTINPQLTSAVSSGVTSGNSARPKPKR